MNEHSGRNWTLHVGDVRDVLSQMPEQSVQCVVTSPPYWGLRYYKLPPSVWGGDPDCEHEWGGTVPGCNRGGSGTPTDKNGRGEGYGRDSERGAFCRCGAWSGCYGLEPTIDLYVEHSVMICRELWRVLRDDGTVWWNLGDSYASSGTSSPQRLDKLGERFSGGGHKHSSHPSGRAPTPHGLKTKDLCGIPWRVALALQADGWYLRSDIIWAKPNAMPSSVTDRPSTAHEYIFLLTKSARYYYDNEAVKEQSAGVSGGACFGKVNQDGPGSRRIDDEDNDRIRSGKRNCRSVWTIPTQAYPEAHFATFPEKLPARCILAGTSEKGCCPECGAPWKRVVERDERELRREPAHCPNNTTTKVDSTGWVDGNPRTTGWEPTCNCNVGEPVPCTVLDIFAGSGTTLKVARELGRHGVGIELSEEYAELAVNRIVDPKRYAAPGQKAIEPLEGQATLF